jgi:protein O-mannosyl-transferase
VASSPAKVVVICLILAAIVFAVLFPVVHNAFTGYDDGDYVVNNPHVNTGLSRANVTWAFSSVHANNWHPLTWLSHALDVTLYGISPTGHHLTSLLFHIANTLLLFLWLAGLTGRQIPSAFVALAFGLHPLHLESVAWVAERKDVLSTFFWFLTLIAWTAYTKRPNLARYLLAALFLTAGLLSKQMLVTVPVLLLLLDIWPLKRGFRLLEKLPLFALSLAASVTVILVQRNTGATSTLQQLPLDLRLANAAISYWRYLAKVIWPVNLSAFYPFSATIPAWQIAAAAACLRRKQNPCFAFGWAWYFITLLPVIGIIQVGMQSMADRYTYVPIIGLFIAAAFETDALAPGAKRILSVAAIALLAGWTTLTWKQIPVWHDGLTLFTQALVADPNNFVAHDNLGVELDRRGRFDEALFHYRETLRLKPGDRNGETNFALASFAKADRLIAANQPDQALSVIREGLRFRPQNALAHAQIGRILQARQQLPEALKEFEDAVRLDPNLAAAHLGLAVIYSWSGKTSEARTEFETTLRLDPINVEAHYDLGLVLTVIGQPREGLQHFLAAAKINPAFGPAHVALAETWYAAGRFADARREVALAQAAHTEVDPALIKLLDKRLLANQR